MASAEFHVWFSCGLRSVCDPARRIALLVEKPGRFFYGPSCRLHPFVQFGPTLNLVGHGLAKVVHDQLIQQFNHAMKILGDLMGPRKMGLRPGFTHDCAFDVSATGVTL